MDLELKGRKALITGASKGIGFATAKLLADEGMDIAICARTAADVEKAVAELRAKGVNAIGDPIDVTKPDEYTAWIDSAAKTPRRPRHLHPQRHGFSLDTPACAAGTSPTRPTSSAPCAAAKPRCLIIKQSPPAKQGAAAIVMISEHRGRHLEATPAQGAYAYGDSEGRRDRVRRATQQGRRETRHPRERHLAGPGPRRRWPVGQGEATLPQAYEAAVKNCVIGRLGKPEDIANAVAFLVSPRSAFTVGPEPAHRRRVRCSTCRSSPVRFARKRASLPMADHAGCARSVESLPMASPRARRHTPRPSHAQAASISWVSAGSSVLAVRRDHRLVQVGLLPIALAIVLARGGPQSALHVASIPDHFR